MIYRRHKSGVLKISDEPLRVIESYRQLDSKAKESGGILLGRMLVDCDDVIIDEVTIPTAGDRSRRFSFYRARGAAQKRVNQVWIETSQTGNYLGEWHTHPEDNPTPSAEDVKNWRRIIKKASFEQDYLFFIIVGCTDIKVWEMYKDEKAPILIEGL